LVDFGFAIKYEDISLTNTEIPFCVGTPGYVAPEMMRGQQYDSRADVFSAGSMLYLMLTYNPAFAASTKEEIIEKNRACEPEWRFWMLPTEPKEYPSTETMELLKTMMAKNPNVRIKAHEALKHPAFNKLKDPVKEVKKKPEVKRKPIGTEFTPNDIPSDEDIKAITEFESTQIFGEKPFPADIIPVIPLDKERNGEIKFWGGASFKQAEVTDAATRTRNFMQRAYSPHKDRSNLVPLQKKSKFLKNNFQMPSDPLIQLPKKVFTFGAEENSNREIGNDTPYNLEPRL
jgi:serine/threonine protein kinase